MQKPFNRRQIINFFLKIGLSLFTFSFGAKKYLKEKGFFSTNENYKTNY